MTDSVKTILILGGAGAQNSAVVHELSKNERFHTKVLSRDIKSDACLILSALPRVTLIQGDCYDEPTLLHAFQGINACFVNTNGFAIGEKSEIFWGIRMYEIAYGAGVDHFIYSSLPYVSKKSGFDPSYRVPFVDGKAKVTEYLQAQPVDKMNWSILESGPYADSHISHTWSPERAADGVYEFRMPIGPNGAMALVSLADLGWFARYMFEHPKEFEGDLLSVGIEHASGQAIASAFTAVTGLPARFQPMDIQDVAATWPHTKIGGAGSPGFDDPTLKTRAGHFVPWFRIWSESGGNQGLWTRDYDRLDKIHPHRMRTVEEWMRKVNFSPTKSVSILRTGLN